MRHFVVSFALLFAVTIESQNQTYPHVVFRGAVLPNHSYVPFAKVDYHKTDYGVECHTDLATCCRGNEGDAAGDWHFPSGIRLSFSQTSDTGVYMRRMPQKVVLYQRQGGTAKYSGIYQCVIPTLSSSLGVKVVYVGIYKDADEGDLQITHAIAFNLAWEIAVDAPVFTLTCTSADGPATTVSWFRDSQYISEGITKLDNTVTSQYTHTLTVTGRLGGLYECRVSNNKPSTAVKNITVHVPAPPSNVTVLHRGDSYLNISWTPPDILEGVSGYIIYYYGDDSSSGNVTVPHGSEDNYQLTGLQSNVHYIVSIAALSCHLPSKVVTIYVTTRHEASQRDVASSSGAISGGVIAGLVVILLVTAVGIAGVWRLRKKKEESAFTIGHKNTDATLKEESECVLSVVEPVILEFPEDTYVTEGEGMEFHVKVTGTPQPRLKWYHEEEMVEADYSIELAENGTIVLPSAESRHSGVYKLVAENKVGRVERKVQLHVMVEEEEDSQVACPQPAVEFEAVPVAMFGGHVEKNHNHNNKGFREEYQCLYRGSKQSVALTSSPENRHYNRFANICPYDDNRVVLREPHGYPNSHHDYINASHIDGYTSPASYIATQGPLPHTVVDFWRMVWQERSPSIVMITNLMEGNKTKCHQYWPDKGSMCCGPFSISITDEQIFADYTLRSLVLKLSEGTKDSWKVNQFHFTAWPDYGVPDYATLILKFLKEVKMKHAVIQGPMIVHCSAGVGRTGTFITLDFCLEQVEVEHMVDIPNIINKIRHQRMRLVQTVEQYVLIHDAVLEYLTCGDTEISAENLQHTLRGDLSDTNAIGVARLQKEFVLLKHVSPKPSEMKADDKWSDYIQATNISGYKHKSAYIITQSPTQETCRHFWNVVYERKCDIVIMLCHLVENDEEVCYQYWPSSVPVTFGEYSIELVMEEKMYGFVKRTLNLINSKSGREHQVIQFQVTNWTPDGSCTNIRVVIEVIEEATRIERNAKHRCMAVHCSDAVSRSGMFCAIATTIGRCKTEGLVDVFQVVKALRMQKPGAVCTLGQYKTIHEAILAYLDLFETYANFK